jgi:hypothetical protein
MCPSSHVQLVLADAGIAACHYCDCDCWHCGVSYRTTDRIDSKPPLHPADVGQPVRIAGADLQLPPRPYTRLLRRGSPYSTTNTPCMHRAWSIFYLWTFHTLLGMTFLETRSLVLHCLLGAARKRRVGGSGPWILGSEDQCYPVHHISVRGLTTSSKSELAGVTVVDSLEG